MKTQKRNKIKNGGALIIYFIALMVIISIKSILPLILLLIVLTVISNRAFLRLAKRAFLSILMFNLIVSVSYIIASIINNREWGGYILLINLRVFNSTFLTFYFIDKFNLFRLLSFSKTLSFLMLISYSQIMIYKRSFENFRLAFKSRNIERISKEKIFEFIKATFLYFLQTSIHTSKDISLAMKSRCLNAD